MRGLQHTLEQIDGAVAQRASAARESATHRFNLIERRGRELEEAVEDARRALDQLGEDDDGSHERHRYAEACRDLRRYGDVWRECVAIRRRFDTQLERLVERSGLLCSLAGRNLAEKIDEAATYIGIQPSGANLRLPTQGSPSCVAQAPVAAHPALARLRETKNRAPTAGLPRGFAWIDLSQLADSGFVDDPAEFKKGITKTQMQRGVERLHAEILPLLKQNPHISRDHFERLDRERRTAYTPEGFVHPDSLAELWTYFFDRNHHAIRIDGVDTQGRLEVGNGRHRLGVAREAGIRFMPVWFQVS